MINSDRYVYQAVFSRDEDGIEVKFPDLPGVITFGLTTPEAIEMAQDALEQYLLACEELGLQPGDASEIGSLIVEPTETIFLIDVWMPLLRDKESNKAVKKTLTIPKWLNDLAIQKGINFSHVLQVGLKSAIGIL